MAPHTLNLFFTRLQTRFQAWKRARIALLFIAACALSTGAWCQFGTPKSGLLGGSGSSGGSGGGSAVVQTEQLRAELVAHAPQGIDPGKTVWLGLRLQHQPHWHTYWKNPGDSGLPTQLQWTLPAGITAGEIAWPVPQKIRIGSLANFGYEGAVLLPVPLTISPAFRPSALQSTLDVTLHAQWLVCQQTCVPQEGDFALRVPLRSSTALEGAAFDAALQAQPRALPSATAQATVEGHTLTLTVRGLPAAWQGQALALLPEEAALVESSASPGGPSDTGPQAPHAWEGAVWRAALPLSAQRSSSFTQAAWVLRYGTESVRVESPISGTWPAVQTTGVSPALQAALDANAQAAATSSPPPPKGREGGLGMQLLGALGLALLGGLVLNLMPCVFPVLAIKVLGVVQHGGRTARLHGLAYGAGVVLSFLALGGLLLALRAGGEQLGWGFQLQSPLVVAALALLFTLLGLNLMGLLELGSLLPSRWASLQLRHPLADAALTGVLAVAIASPCTAPFMGAALGYAIALPAAAALAVFAALGVGLALPYVLLTWFPAALRWLPRPGAWMDTLRRAMAFPMWATVVWLVWVLGHLQGMDGAATLLALLLCVAMLAWGLQLQGRSRMVIAIISIAAGAVIMGASGQNITQAPSAEALGGNTTKAITSATTSSATGTSVGTVTTPTAWQAWSPERVQAALAAGQPVFVDFTAAWCITCQVNKKTTLSQPALLADMAAKRVALLRADWTRRDPTITQALTQLGRSGVPVYVLYAPGKAPVVLTELLSVQEVQAALQTL